MVRLLLIEEPLQETQYNSITNLIAVTRNQDIDALDLEQFVLW